MNRWIMLLVTLLLYSQLLWADCLEGQYEYSIVDATIHSMDQDSDPVQKTLRRSISTKDNKGKNMVIRTYEVVSEPAVVEFEKLERLAAIAASTGRRFTAHACCKSAAYDDRTISVSNIEQYNNCVLDFYRVK